MATNARQQPRLLAGWSSPEPKPELLSPLSVALDEVADVFWHFEVIDVAARLYSSAMSADTSFAQCSSVLKATTRTGLLNWPVIISETTVSRSARSISVSL